MSLESKHIATEMTEKKLRIMLFEQKRVIVRIWTSSVNRSYPGDNVGHVSIQTPNQYISLWPKEALSTKGSAPPKLPESFIEDVRLENDRRPELTFCFYSLDRHAIDKSFTVFKNSSDSSYSLLGIRTNSTNCAQLALKLLIAGGVGRLISLSAQSSICCKRGTKDKALSKGEIAQSISQAAFFQDHESKTAFSRGANDLFRSVEMLAPIQNPDKLAELLQKAKKIELGMKEYQPTRYMMVVEGEWRPPEKSIGACAIL